MKDETVWLTQKTMATLFDVQVPAIHKHLKNIFDSGELEKASVISILETTASDGKTYRMNFYNLDAIIAVGYRVNAHRATQFRIWATKTVDRDAREFDGQEHNGMRIRIIGTEGLANLTDEFNNLLSEQTEVDV